MRKYIAVKIVEATTMTANNAGIHLGRQIDAGSAVIDRDGDCRGYLVRYADGYESWCPEQQFDEANRPCDAMTFGLAIEAMKRGHRVARKGWNGKGLFIFLVENWTYTDGKQDNLRNLPTLVMKTVDDCAVPWLASQTDMLADDWVVIE